MLVTIILLQMQSDTSPVKLKPSHDRNVTLAQEVRGAAILRGRTSKHQCHIIAEQQPDEAAAGHQQGCTSN